MNRRFRFSLSTILIVCLLASPAVVQADDEITEESEAALKLGLEWLAKNQGDKGNWNSKHLGLVGMGALAFLSDGHLPGRGKYGDEVDKSLEFILVNAKDSGLLNIAEDRRDMYNHGLATFVLGQAHGMTDDQRLTETLDKSLKLISQTQCEDGGWDYVAHRQQRGHDLSLAVMQAKALRSAVDSGLEVPPEVVELAIQSVREHYSSKGGGRNLPESEQKKHPGQFTYSKGGSGGSTAMAAAGVVCLQEFGQYDDWRIPKNMDIIAETIKQKTKGNPGKGSGQMPFDAYTLYYVGQALYQVGDPYWSESYPRLRDHLVRTQMRNPDDPSKHGKWTAGAHVSGTEGDMYGTAVACFILAMPNRYLPILQEGKIEGFREQNK